MSPRTVRILLTGYADLDAVEGSINESEVFRFLTKPCAPQQLRETIELAAKLAREAPAPVPTEALLPGETTSGDTIEIILESDTVTEVGGAPTPAPAVQRSTSSTAAFEQPKFAMARATAPMK